MKYQYKITYLMNGYKDKSSIESYNKMLVINEYIKLLTTENLNISELKFFKINTNTQKEREITQEINKFLYK